MAGNWLAVVTNDFLVNDGKPEKRKKHAIILRQNIKSDYNSMIRLLK